MNLLEKSYQQPVQIGDFIVKHGCAYEYVGQGGIVNIPEGIKGLESLAFYKCSEKVINSITKIILPSTFEMSFELYSLPNCKEIECNAKIVGEKSFSLKSLEKIVFSKDVLKIDNYAFFGCNNLKFVYVGDNTKISKKAFSYCNKRIKICKLNDKDKRKINFRFDKNKFFDFCDFMVFGWGILLVVSVIIGFATDNEFFLYIWGVCIACGIINIIIKLIGDYFIS